MSVQHSLSCAGVAEVAIGLLKDSGADAMVMVSREKINLVASFQEKKRRPSRMKAVCRLAN